MTFDEWLKGPHEGNFNDCNHPLTPGESVAAYRAWNAALESRVLAERKPENQQMFALIRDRNYDGEGLTVWTWNGENYSGSDGDCLSRERDGTLDGFEAEFLTDHQLEQRLNAATHPTPDDESDAVRYRWLREGGKDQHDMFDSVWGDTLDAAIDRARKGNESGA
jgi:hypothetical protein